MRRIRVIICKITAAIKNIFISRWKLGPINGITGRLKLANPASAGKQQAGDNVIVIKDHRVDKGRPPFEKDERYFFMEYNK